MINILQRIDLDFEPVKADESVMPAESVYIAYYYRSCITKTSMKNCILETIPVLIAHRTPSISIQQRSLYKGLESTTCCV